jgi:hypothetical protein
MDYEFEMTPHGNELLTAGDLTISYRSAAGFASMGGFGAVRSLFGPETGQGETALVLGGEYFILNGDFRAEYREILSAGEGTEGCLAFYRKMRGGNGSSWSNDLPEEERL